MGAPFNAVVSQQRGVQLYAVTKTGLGSPELVGLNAYQMSVSAGTTGQYVVSFPAGGNSDSDQNYGIVAVATATTDNIICKIGTKTVSSVEILTENLSGSATAGDFDLIVINTSARDLQA